ncbi:MAG: MATE family efflux transporter, partial [Rubrivivax sp.]
GAGPGLRALRGVAGPLFLELGLAIAVGTAATVLAARLSDEAAAAFSLANHVAAMVFLVFRIVGAGVGVVVAQDLGAGRREAADRVARATVGAGTWIGGAAALATFVGAAPLLSALGAPAAVLPLATPLLQGLALSMVLDAWNASMGSVLRAHLRARESLAVIVAMQALTLAMAAWLMPRLGLAGYAWALLAGRALGLGLHLLLWRRSLGLLVRPSDAWRLPAPELAAVLRIGAPAAAENIAYRLCFMASVAVAGGLGAAALATQAYALQISYAAVMAGLAIGLAGEVVVGHLVGAGRLREAHALVRRALAMGLLVSLVATTAVALAGPWLLRGFTSDPQIVAAGATLLWWTVLLEPGRTFNLVVINALRAAGDARYPVVVGAGSMVLVLAGGSWLLGHALGLGLVGVWIAYAADEWLRGLLMWRRWVRLGWLPSARAARARRLRR